MGTIRIDAAVTAAHQWVVDSSQRTGAWWGRQTIILLVLAAVARWHLDGVSTVGTVILLICAACGYAVTHSSELFYTQTGFGSVMRKLWLVLTCIDLLMLVLIGKPGPAGFTVSMCITAWQYFATCKPPRPRVPRTKMAHAGGAA